MDGGIKFDVSANTAKFEADMGRVKNSASGTAGAVGKAFSGLGGLFVGGALVAGLTGLLRKMDDISDGARRMGISAKEFQKIGNAAELVGTSVETVNKAMIRAGVAANKAAREGGAVADAFERADLDPAKFAAAGLEDRIKMVAEAQRAANGDAQKMSELFEAIGVKAAGIDFSSLADEMANVNAASDSTVEALARANDELDKAKQNATIFGANLIAGITGAAERLGNILGGDVGRTNSEIDAQVARDNAKAALQNRGELLPDDSTTRTTQKFVGGPVPATVQENVPGPNAQENNRRIDAEIKAQEELNKAKEAEARLARETGQSETEQVAKTEEKAKQEADILKFKQYMLEIDLKIKEAQAAGDQERAASLQAFKDWTESAIKYEGDFDKAARDVNATLAERNRLREQEIAKQQASIEAELKHAEAMAFGTEEAKAKAEWMNEYNRRISEGASDEQAKRFANASTFEPPPEAGSDGGGGGSGRGGRGGGSTEDMTFNERVGDLRGRGLRAGDDERAGQHASRGAYDSAIRAQDRAQRTYDRAMDNARIKDAASEYEFDGRAAGNVGEAFDAFREEIGGLNVKDNLKSQLGSKYNPKLSNEENFKRMLKEQGKTPEERSKEDEEEKNRNGKGGSKSPSQNEALTGYLEKILNEIKERLPIVALG